MTTTTGTPERRPHYASRQAIDDFHERLAEVRVALGDLAEDIAACHAEGLQFPLDEVRGMLATLRDAGNRQQEIHVSLAHATDPWVPGTQWEADFIGLISLAGSAAALLCPDRSAVLGLDEGQADTLDDALDAVEINLARYRRLLAARHAMMPAEVPTAKMTEREIDKAAEIIMRRVHDAITIGADIPAQAREATREIRRLWAPADTTE